VLDGVVVRSGVATRRGVWRRGEVSVARGRGGGAGGEGGVFVGWGGTGCGGYVGVGLGGGGWEWQGWGASGCTRAGGGRQRAGEGRQGGGRILRDWCQSWECPRDADSTRSVGAAREEHKGRWSAHGMRTGVGGASGGKGGRGTEVVSATEFRVARSKPAARRTSGETAVGGRADETTVLRGCCASSAGCGNDGRSSRGRQ